MAAPPLAELCGALEPRPTPGFESHSRSDQIDQQLDRSMTGQSYPPIPSRGRTETHLNILLSRSQALEVITFSGQLTFSISGPRSRHVLESQHSQHSQHSQQRSGGDFGSKVPAVSFASIRACTLTSGLSQSSGLIPRSSTADGIAAWCKLPPQFKQKRSSLYISSTRGGVQAIAQVTIPSAFPVVDEVAEVSVSTQQDQRSVKTSKACHHKRKIPQ